MDWIKTEDAFPSTGTPVLATVRCNETNVKAVVPCVYDWLTDYVTGEVLGGETFLIHQANGDADATIDYNDGKIFQTLAWMPFPEPCDQFRVIVAGSRTFGDYRMLSNTLDKAFERHWPTAIVCGEARGADLLGKRYAQEHQIPVNSYPADWNGLGKSAGYIRNEKMAANAEALIAFWNGSSVGTKHMIDTAKKKNLQVRVVKV